MSLIQCIKNAYAEFKREREYEKKKAALLNRNMDYSFLEEIVQKMNENPLLSVTVNLKDGTRISLNTMPRNVNGFTYNMPHEERMEVR